MYKCFNLCCLYSVFCAHPKPGQNILFGHFQPFLLIVYVFSDFFVWSQEKSLKKQCFKLFFKAGWHANTPLSILSWFTAGSKEDHGYKPLKSVRGSRSHQVRPNPRDRKEKTPTYEQGRWSLKKTNYHLPNWAEVAQDPFTNHQQQTHKKERK